MMLIDNKYNLKDRVYLSSDQDQKVRKLKLLVKIATRSRAPKFIGVLRRYVDTIADHSNTLIVVSYDDDDDTMTEVVVGQCSAMHPCVKMVAGISKNKIDACNRDIPDDGWDVLILGSDDMMPMIHGWDQIIRHKMVEDFYDTDGCLWFYDGHQKRICTYSVMGKSYYDRYGYIYHPDYTSLWCDNEWTEVAQLQNKLRYHDDLVFRHEHPMWMNEPEKMDDQYRHTESFYSQDKNVYKHRKNLGFP